jgi:hypothetical protein
MKRLSTHNSHSRSNSQVQKCALIFDNQISSVFQSHSNTSYPPTNYPMKISRAVAAIAAFSLGAISANAAIIASTNFDGRTLTASDTTATSLIWTTNGVANPGNMVSLNASAAGLALFNGNSLTQNMFAPALNTANVNTFWTTNVSLIVSPGSTVTLTDVTFNAWSLNGSQLQNANKKLDFTVSLIDPSAATIATVDITDLISGTGVGSPLATATFSSAMALSAPGTYTLRIKGGDFLGIDEFGNHTAIDNLSINGTFAAVPEPSAALLGGLGLLALLRRRR